MRHGSCPQAQTDHAHTSDRTCGTRPYGYWGTTGGCAYSGGGEVFDLSGIGSGFQSSETTSTPEGRVFFFFSKMEHVVVEMWQRFREIRERSPGGFFEFFFIYGFKNRKSKHALFLIDGMMPFLGYISFEWMLSRKVLASGHHSDSNMYREPETTS